MSESHQSVDDMLSVVNSELPALLGEPPEGAPGQPIVFVLGPPRSGTTLMVQALAGDTGLAYLDNLAALFWARPDLGLSVSRMVQGDVRPGSRLSRFGRTVGATEPHEAGRMWTAALGVNTLIESEARDVDDSDLARLRGRLRAVAAAAGRPLVLKAFHGVFLVDRLAQALPEAVFVRLHRPPVAVVDSLLRMRSALGGLDRWQSVRPVLPPSIEHGAPVLQVAGQVLAVERALDTALDSVSPGRVHEVEHEELVVDPGAMAWRVVDRFGLKAPAPVGDSPLGGAVPHAVDDATIRAALADATAALDG